MGHKRQLDMFGVRRQNWHEDFGTKKERKQEDYLPTCPIVNSMAKI